MPRGIPNASAADEPALSERAQTTRRERRRREGGDLDRTQRLKLSIPENVREWAAREGMELRFVNDHENRMHAMTKLDDWDIVPSELGVEPIPVDVSKDGKPVKAYLCAKPHEFMEEDRRRKAREIDDTEKGILRSAGAADPATAGDQFYTGANNRIGANRAPR